MIKIKYLVFILTMVFSLNVQAGIDFGADLVSRYIWRGIDFGNSASVQPFLSFSVGGFEAGAWASYPFTNTGEGTNENDLYVIYSFGSVALSVTDYYFPEGLNFGDYSDDGGHIIEGAVSLAFGSFGLLGAVNAYGDGKHSAYFEGTYEFYNEDDLSAGALLAIGNNSYVSDESGNFNVVTCGITAAKGNMSASYIINPDLNTNYLIFNYGIRL